MDAADRYLNVMDLIEKYVKACITKRDADLSEHIRLMQPEFEAYVALSRSIADLCREARGLPVAYNAKLDAASQMRPTLTTEQRRLAGLADSEIALDGAVRNLIREVVP